MNFTRFLESLCDLLCEQCSFFIVRTGTAKAAHQKYTKIGIERGMRYAPGRLRYDSAHLQDVQSKSNIVLWVRDVVFLLSERKKTTEVGKA